MKTFVSAGTSELRSRPSCRLRSLFWPVSGSVCFLRVYKYYKTPTSGFFKIYLQVVFEETWYENVNASRPPWCVEVHCRLLQTSRTWSSTLPSYYYYHHMYWYDFYITSGCTGVGKLVYNLLHTYCRFLNFSIYFYLLTSLTYYHFLNRGSLDT